ncbi:hypothetical protein LEP1GSC029_3987 [Leptospira interrogans str. 2002000626]|uniref:Uncharacterized protein n=1 Tax=Leptospira interrogans str. 2002000626 TaxID=996803 RepID=A0A829DCZ0_LEPIR|nr:hypothetical protein LEP1GSC029_3987 [Leptospira interrogans str. 2002000626]
MNVFIDKIKYLFAVYRSLRLVFRILLPLIPFLILFYFYL